MSATQLPTGIIPGLYYALKCDQVLSGTVVADMGQNHTRNCANSFTAGRNAKPCSLALGVERDLSLKISVEKFPWSQLNLWIKPLVFDWWSWNGTSSVHQHEYPSLYKVLGFYFSMANMERGCIRMPFILSLLLQLTVMFASLPGWKVHPVIWKLRVCHVWEYPKGLHGENPSNPTQ